MVVKRQIKLIGVKDQLVVYLVLLVLVLLVVIVVHREHRVERRIPVRGQLFLVKLIVLNKIGVGAF